jgi:antitoxin (DNA-binding transcriptional repressor) of toxin-antitoxin stability system
MRVVGIKQLKAKLSEFLRDVRRGEVFLVTDRDEVVAELGPPRARATPVADDELARTFEALAATGEVTLTQLEKGDWRWSPRGAGLPEGSADALLDDLRADRS